ncbi:unnamed protein product [Prorocentrum cordatum]|uniref:Uncharacterized protein n=1 Tax=Prorocentrum cordatum TaxID=2364126 RepID=A0ABN9PLA3_9DINO|nr:unnamed protein product [Polarella glacialis]
MPGRSRGRRAPRRLPGKKREAARSLAGRRQEAREAGGPREEKQSRRERSALPAPDDDDDHAVDDEDVDDDDHVVDDEGGDGDRPDPPPATIARGPRSAGRQRGSAQAGLGRSGGCCRILRSSSSGEASWLAYRTTV